MRIEVIIYRKKDSEDDNGNPLFFGIVKEKPNVSATGRSPDEMMENLLKKYRAIVSQESITFDPIYAYA